MSPRNEQQLGHVALGIKFRARNNDKKRDHGDSEDDEEGVDTLRGKARKDRSSVVRNNPNPGHAGVLYKGRSIQIARSLTVSSIAEAERAAYGPREFPSITMC
eukprot:6936649-Prymnesium_polylepis.1